jgi:hypothetical protein
MRVKAKQIQPNPQIIKVFGFFMPPVSLMKHKNLKKFWRQFYLRFLSIPLTVKNGKLY